MQHQEESSAQLQVEVEKSNLAGDTAVSADVTHQEKVEGKEDESEAQTQQPPAEPTELERFYRAFQTESDELLEKVEGIPNIPASSRQDVVDDVLAHIAKLSNDIKDASPILPLYDQKIYSEKVRKISDALANVKASVAPRAKFSFSRKKKAAASATEPPVLIPNNSHVGASSALASPAGNDIKQSGSPLVNKDEGDNTTPAPPLPLQRGPVSNSVALSSHHDTRLLLPFYDPPQPCSIQISALDRCLVDLLSQSRGTKKFLGLAARDISSSLVLCGKVQGSAHVTNVNRSIIVVSCKQFRLHDSKDTDVYLMCPSRPIIEHCKGIRFARFPEEMFFDTTFEEESKGSLWDHVDDFDWPNQDALSPNWKLLPSEDKIAGKLWGRLASESEEIPLVSILDKYLPSSASRSSSASSSLLHAMAGL